MRAQRPALTTAGLGLGLLLAAGAFDAEALYVPGVAFTLIGLAAIAWVQLGALGLVVEREVAAHTLVEGEPTDVRIRVRAGVTRLPTGVVDDGLLAEPAPLRVGRRAMALRVRVSFARRGRRVLEPVRVVVRDPAGLAERTIVRARPEELLVLPRVSPVETVAAPGGGAGSLLGGGRRRPAAAAEVDLDGLRPHRPGAPAARIHWGVFARTGELHERRLTAEADTLPLVVLDPRSDPAAGEELDAAVRAVASLAVHLARAGGCALLLPGDRRATVLAGDLAAWPRQHVRLAVVGAGEGPSLAGLAARRGPVFYVAARAASRPPRALAHAPGAGRVLVVPGVLPGRRPSFTVAGCSGYPLRAGRTAEAA